MNTLNPQNIPFQQILKSLLDNTTPFPPTYLHRFSDLSSVDLQSLKVVWPQVSVNRRRALLEDLEELGDADYLLSFDDIARFALKDEDHRVRALAIRLLWENEDKKLAPVFINMMKNDPEPEVRSTAASALGRFVYLGEVEEIPDSLLHEVEENLLAIYHSNDQASVRRRALEALGYSGRSEVPELLRSAYQEADSGWLESALFAMSRSADDAWVGHILPMLSHTLPSVRLEAVRAAGELGLNKARDQLLELLMEDEEEDDDVREAAIWSLSQIGGEQVRPFLERMLEETEDEDEAELLEDALDNLSFTEDMNIFEMFDFDTDQPDEIFEEDKGRKNEFKDQKSKKEK